MKHKSGYNIESRSNGTRIYTNIFAPHVVKHSAYVCNKNLVISTYIKLSESFFRFIRK